MTNSIHRLVSICVAGWLLLCSPLASAVSPAQEVTAFDSERFSLGVGVGVVRFDTKVKVTNRVTGGSRFLDLEGNLDLPEDDTVNTIYGAYRFNERHSLVFAYFAINRESELIDFSRNYDDIVLVEASLKLEDNSRFYNLGYGYNLFRDDRSAVTLIAGLNTIDLRMEAEARGSITFDGETVSAVEVASADLVAPLPLFGLNFGFSFTPEWSIRTKIALVTGSYDDVSASVYSTSINSLYRFNRHTGVILGLTYFDADVEEDDDDEITDISYGYQGAFIGLLFTL